MAILIEVCCSFPQSLHENSGTVPQLGHNHFLPNSFQFIIHLSSYHSTLCSPATKIKVKLHTCAHACTHIHTHKSKPSNKITWATYIALQLQLAQHEICSFSCAKQNKIRYIWFIWSLYINLGIFSLYNPQSGIRVWKRYNVVEMKNQKLTSLETKVTKQICWFETTESNTAVI
jgi:hypothetical protein